MNSESHSMEKKQLLESLKATEKGLSTQEAEQRLQEYGPNELATKKGVSPLSIFLRQFKDIFVIMLLVAILISVGINEYVDAAIIATIVFLNAIVGGITPHEHSGKGIPNSADLSTEPRLLFPR